MISTRAERRNAARIWRAVQPKAARRGFTVSDAMRLLANRYAMIKGAGQ